MKVPSLGSLLKFQKALDSRAFFCCIYKKKYQLELESLLGQFQHLDLNSLIKEHGLLSKNSSEISSFLLSYKLKFPLVVFLLREEDLKQYEVEFLKKILMYIPKVCALEADLSDYIIEEGESSISEFPNKFLKNSYKLSNVDDIHEWLQWQYFLSNPVSKSFGVYKITLLVLLFLPFVIGFLLIETDKGNRFTSGIEQKKVQIDKKASDCLFEGEVSETNLRQVYQSTLFKNQIFMPPEARILEFLNSHVKNIDSNTIFSATKKIKLCIKPDKDKELYEDEEFEAYKWVVAMTSDSLAYPTDYWWDGAETIHRKHHGVDVGAKAGSIVYSPLEGVVNMSEGGPGGRMLGIIQDKKITYFAHLDHYMVFSGDTVKKGEPIASIGMTGRTTGPHLHLMTGYIENGEKKWVNPIQWYLDNEAKNEQ